MTTENIGNSDSAENIDELGLSDRGIAAQAWGFGIVGCISVAVLHMLSGSDYLLYQWFETAAKELYWAFVVPLAALIEWGRKMFERGKAIREAKIREMEAKARQAGVQDGIMQERKRSNANLRALAEKYGIPENELPFTDEDA